MQSRHRLVYGALRIIESVTTVKHSNCIAANNLEDHKWQFLKKHGLNNFPAKNVNLHKNTPNNDAYASDATLRRIAKTTNFAFRLNCRFAC